MKNKTLLIDLDGTIYKGHTLQPLAKEFITYLQDNNIDFYFFTNNARRTGKQNVEHLNNLGIYNIKEEQFFTSAIASAMYLEEHYPNKTVFLVGEEGLQEAIDKTSLKTVETNADIVLVGLDYNGNYDLYSKALTNIMQGGILIATNMDRRIPVDKDYKLGNGATVAMLEYASTKEAIKLGKPSKAYVDMALKYTNKTKDEVIIVGDNLETDILCGYQNDVDTLLYTQGIHQREDIDKLNIKPTYIIDSYDEIIKK